MLRKEAVALPKLSFPSSSPTGRMSNYNREWQGFQQHWDHDQAELRMISQVLAKEMNPVLKVGKHREPQKEPTEERKVVYINIVSSKYRDPVDCTVMMDPYLVPAMGDQVAISMLLEQGKGLTKTDKHALTDLQEASLFLRVQQRTVCKGFEETQYHWELELRPVDECGFSAPKVQFEARGKTLPFGICGTLEIPGDVPDVGDLVGADLLVGLQGLLNIEKEVMEKLSEDGVDFEVVERVLDRESDEDSPPQWYLTVKPHDEVLKEEKWEALQDVPLPVDKPVRDRNGTTYETVGEVVVARLEPEQLNHVRDRKVFRWLKKLGVYPYEE